MSDQLKKRFWKAVDISPEGAGFGVQLDGRGIRTPAKTRVVIPSKPLAEAVAGEWDAVVEQIDPGQMPMTRRVNAALDKVAAQRAEVSAMLADYALSDLLCYRAEFPTGLQARQARIWDPYLTDFRVETGVSLAVTSGVIPQDQPEAAGAAAIAAMQRLGLFQLTAFHDLVTLSGSMVLALAAMKRDADIAAIWEASVLDDLWQFEQWGEDEDAAATLALKRQDFMDARRFFALAGDC